MKKFFSVPLVLAALVFSPLPLGADPHTGFIEAPSPMAEENSPPLWMNRFTLSFSGTLLFFLENNGMEGDASPVIPSFGAALAFHVWGPLSVELTEDLYFTYYDYSNNLERAVHVDRENRSAFVFGFFTGLQVMARFPITGLLSIRAYGGPAVDLRIVARADSSHPDDADMGEKTDAVRQYFGSGARWFYPVIGTGLDFAANERFLVGLDFRLWFPLYRVWTGEKLPASEGWRMGAGLRFTIR
ncbi:MAG: hypothetical protein LBI86_09445 [Treponema sp.]|jgi:hypothetical protein|nr:hypothetical protein [Treponema sp.]